MTSPDAVVNPLDDLTAVDFDAAFDERLAEFVRLARRLTRRYRIMQVGAERASAAFEALAAAEAQRARLQAARLAR